METLSQDVRFALRSLIKNPVFAIVSTVTLALAIGVNTSIFSLVSAIVFADVPMQDVDRTTMIRGVNAELGVSQGSVSSADFLDIEERSRSFESLSALTEEQWVLTGVDEPTRVGGLRMNASTVDAWVLPPVLGRSFTEEEDRPGGPRVAMLTHGYWQDRFGGRTDVLGETVALDGLAHTIVGVMHPKLEFASFRAAQVIVPLRLDGAAADRTDRNLFVSGHLAEGVTAAMAAEEVKRIGDDLAREHPTENRGWGLWSAPVMESLIDDGAKRVLLLLQLTVAMVILIACANVANMLLARSASRARELAVRSALGAGRARLLRQLLTESLIISLASATLGLGVAALLNRGLVWISAGNEEAFIMAEIDGRVLAFTLVVSLLAPLAFGLFPAVRAAKAGARAGLRDRGSTDGGRSGSRARSVLVTAQVSLALSLMIVATILTRTVAYGTNRPLSFDPANLVAVRVDLPEHTYGDDDAILGFLDRAREEIASIRGFERTEIATGLPTTGERRRRPVEIGGTTLPDDRAAQAGVFTTVSPGYLDMLGVPLLAGRGFADGDDRASTRVAIVSTEAAERFWPEGDPIGRQFRVAGNESWYEVVGVVPALQEPIEGQPPSPAIYVPIGQEPTRAVYFVSRTAEEPGDLGGPLRAALRASDPQLPIESIRTLAQARYETQASNYALLSLFATFALFALVMAAVGIYGVMSYSVSQRKNEIGLRMALGAETGAVRWMILRQGAKLLGFGVGLGLLAAFGMSRLLSSMVVGISPTDPLTFTLMPLVLIVVAVIANLIPARRATRMDPATSLRAE